MKNKNDKTLIWAVSGMIATAIFSDAYSVFLKLAGFELQYSWNFAADYIIQGRQNIESFSGVVIGLTTNFFIGGLNGFLIGLILEWLGEDYYYLKGMGVALSNWLALGIMTQVMPYLFTYHLTPLNFLTYIPSYSLFGAFAGYLIVRWSKRQSLIDN
jgi:hypothetical protein